jgi:hypothetical protein
VILCNDFNRAFTAVETYGCLFSCDGDHYELYGRGLLKPAHKHRLFIALKHHQNMYIYNISELHRGRPDAREQSYRGLLIFLKELWGSFKALKKKTLNI